MLCPHCMVQMHQVIGSGGKGVGGGESTDESYTTWELKECSVCFRIYKEFYSATLLSIEEAKEIDHDPSIVRS